MKQIIPFKKELLFKTKISEITSISLEHTLHLNKDDIIQGEFHIAGDYKMTEASINREKFSFSLPFEIEMDAKYVLDTVSIDIDNFYYEVVNDDTLQVNIDVYIDGEKIEEVNDETIKIADEDNVIDNIDSDERKEIDNNDDDKIIDVVRDIKKEIVIEEDSVRGEIDKDKDNSINNDNSDDNVNIINQEVNEIQDIQKIDYTNEVAKIDKDDDSLEVNVIKDNNFNFFNTDNFNTDTYVTYYVYIVKEDDTIDKIMEKFNVSKDEIANYNDLSEVKKGVKLIIPTCNNE